MNVVKKWTRELTEVTGGVGSRIARAASPENNTDDRGNITTILRDAKRRAEAAGGRCANITDEIARYRCKIGAYNSAIQYLRGAKDRCQQNRDPENCKRRMESEIQKLQQRINEAESKINAARAKST